MDSFEIDRLVRLSRLAMLIECEGSITIGMQPPTKTRNRPALYPTVDVTNTDPRIIAEARQTLMSEGVACTARPKRPANGEGRKDRYDLNIHGFDRVNKVLGAILPLLRYKKRQGEILLEFIESRKSGHRHAAYTEQQWKMVTEVRKLNGRMPGTAACVKAKAFLESTNSAAQPRTAEYFRRYLQMCEELRTALVA